MKNVITVFQNRDKGEVHTYDNHAIIVDPQFEPFLLTQFDLYFVSFQEVSNHFSNYKATHTFNKKKRNIAITLLVLALPMAIFYLLYSLNVLPWQVPSLVLVLVKEEIFLAAFALLVLWHDLVTNFDAQKHLIQYPILDDFTINSIDERGIQFPQYTLQRPLDYFHPMTMDLLAQSLVKKNASRIMDTKKLLLSLLSHPNVERVLRRLEIPEVKSILESIQLSGDTTPEYPFTALQSFILYATEQAILTKSRKVYPEHLLLTLFESFPILKEVLQQHKVDFLTFVKVIEWYIINEQYAARTNAFDLSIPYHEKGGVVDGWVHGFTFYLDRISENVLEKIIKQGGIYGIGHEKEINTLIGILQKQYNANAILVGDPGVGKSSIILGLAQRIVEGIIPKQLSRLGIREVNINKLISLAASGPGGLPELTQKLSAELRKQVGTMLYFDDLEALLSTNTGEGTAISYLLPLFLESPVPIIGTMTYAQYARLREHFPTFIDAFKEIRVDPLSQEDTFTILASKIHQLEKFHKITISFPALRDILTLTETYQPNKKFPKKAVELLELAAVQASNTQEKAITRALVTTVTETLTNVPAIHSSPEEAEKLLTLERRIHQRYVNQTDAVLAVVDALQRAKTQVRDASKPFGVFLFLGPSGVGKTELAKITAEEYFGGEFSLIRLDLSQIRSEADIPMVMERLEKVALRPYTLLLLDEFEKTIPPIHDMFMRLFDEGVLVTHKDETLYFNNTIVIATSNIGSDLLLNAPKESFDAVRQEVMELLPQYLKVELINRFDKILVFEALSLENLQQITTLMLNELVGKLAEQGIQATYSEKTVQYIVSIGYKPGMGARPLKRAIQDTIESGVSKVLLEAQRTTGKNPSTVSFDALLPPV